MSCEVADAAYTYNRRAAVVSGTKYFCHSLDLCNAPILFRKGKLTRAKNIGMILVHKKFCHYLSLPFEYDNQTVLHILLFILLMRFFADMWHILYIDTYKLLNLNTSVC